MLASSQTGLRQSNTNVNEGEGNLESQKGSPQDSKLSRGDSPFVAQAQSCGLPLNRDSLDNYGVSLSAKEVLMASWRTGTTKQYQAHLTKRLSYCNENAVNVTVFRPGINQGVEFLETLFRSGLGCSVTLNDGSKFGEHPLICRCLIKRFMN